MAVLFTEKHYFNLTYDGAVIGREMCLNLIFFFSAFASIEVIIVGICNSFVLP